MKCFQTGATTDDCFPLSSNFIKGKKTDKNHFLFFVDLNLKI